jgi:non-ribosomal peptide synthetase component F
MQALSPISVQAWFEDQVRISPEAVAVVFDEKEMTYAQLNVRANQLARRLDKLGVGPDKLVAVCLERSFDLIVILLGILKAGGAYLPIDPALPKERQALMLDDAQPLVLITERLLQPELPPVNATLFVIDAERASLETESGKDVPGRVTGKNLAYVMYTSGSTGTPKGVEIAHEALVNFLGSMQERPGLTARDILVAVTTFSFDIAGLEIFLPLVTGARLIFLSHAVDVAHAARREMAGQPAAQNVVRRRGAAQGTRHAVAGQGRRTLEHVRPDGDDDLVLRRAHHG